VSTKLPLRELPHLLSQLEQKQHLPQRELAHHIHLLLELERAAYQSFDVLYGILDGDAPCDEVRCGDHATSPNAADAMDQCGMAVTRFGK
jgi:hypothetical protein